MLALRSVLFRSGKTFGNVLLGNQRIHETVSRAFRNPFKAFNIPWELFRDQDPELPCPADPSNRPLYDEYISARKRYYSLRDDMTFAIVHEPASSSAIGAPSAFQKSSEQLGVGTDKDVFAGIMNAGGYTWLEERTGKKHLSPAKFLKPYFPAPAAVYGPEYRVMVCVPCQLPRNSSAPLVNVWFEVNASCIETYIDPKVASVLTGNPETTELTLAIGDPSTRVPCVVSNTEGVNVLGLKGVFMYMGMTMVELAGSSITGKLNPCQ